MKPNSQRRFKEPKEVTVGSVMVSKPFWQDDTYKRSVILLLEHDQNGSAGVIINKPSTLSIHDALPDLNILYPLFFGGPSEIKTVSYIHNNPNVPEAIHVGNGMYWGGDFDEVVKMISEYKLDIRLIKFCAGFVHWAPGQLEAEIQEDKWWIDEISPGEIFATPPDDLWAYKLISGGHVYGLLNNIPDPALN
jgi:putative transcriptional regulator